MSEPANGGKQQPDPDPQRNPEGDPNEVKDQVQDETPDSVFNDPTEPVWADPTAPIPAPPTPPGAANPQSDRPPASPQGTPPAPPPLRNPYAQQPPAQPYGQPPAQPYGQPPAQPYGQPPAQPYGQPPAQPYGQPQPGPQYSAYSQQPYATGQHIEANGSAIVLTVLSGVSLVFCNILAIASLVLGIVALTRNTTDHEGSRRLTKIGWIVLAAAWAVAILGVIAYVVFVATVVHNGSTSNDMFGN
jgi:hypothetical protein